MPLLPNSFSIYKFPLKEEEENIRFLHTLVQFLKDIILFLYMLTKFLKLQSWTPLFKGYKPTRAS